LRTSVSGFRLPESLDVTGRHRKPMIDPSATGTFRRASGQKNG